MSKSIKRWIDADRFEKMKQDTAFLVDHIRRSCGEIDLRLRDNYFNLYYKGNSMTKVSVLQDGRVYDIATHAKFTDTANPMADPSTRSHYPVNPTQPSELKRVLSRRRLEGIASRIKQVNWGEEVTFEQMLITDNPPSPEFMIIDRQITGGALGRSRLDLLALRRTCPESSEYRFVVLEVKLGYNPELEGKVLAQLRTYLHTLDNDLDAFARCYEKTYHQMQAMGLLGDGMPTDIRITGPVEGMIVVGGYSGLAKGAIDSMRQFKQTNPDPSDSRISVWWQPSSLSKGSTPL